MELGKAFEERLAEIETYLSLLEGLEAEARTGPPRFGSSGAIITAQQQRILYAGVYLHLYNLVEATIVRCLDCVTSAAAGSVSLADLTEELRREWVRVTARTHKDLTYENRLKSALALCDHLIAALPVSQFSVEKGGGSWDDSSIEQVSSRLGLTLRVSAETYSEIKRPFRDDLGPMGLIVKFRNLLAHGSISFAECGDNHSAAELRDLSRRTANYMREVVTAFTQFVDEQQFLVPTKRPAPATQ